MASSHSDEYGGECASQAPKYGNVIENRIFVGGITNRTYERMLYDIFSGFGRVLSANVVRDRAGVPKGYAFVTFESSRSVELLLRKKRKIVIDNRTVSIAPAIRRMAQQPSRSPCFYTSESPIPYGPVSQVQFPVATDICTMCIPTYSGDVSSDSPVQQTAQPYFNTSPLNLVPNYIVPPVFVVQPLNTNFPAFTFVQPSYVQEQLLPHMSDTSIHDYPRHVEE